MGQVLDQATKPDAPRNDAEYESRDAGSGPRSRGEDVAAPAREQIQEQTQERTRPSFHVGWRTILAVGLVICAAFGGMAFHHWRVAQRKAAAALTAAETVVPVTQVTVQAADVPITLDGLGTVQAFNTVSVRTQIDGQLASVDFREGQDVKQGDVLAHIDPRSYQAQLKSAQAKLAQDQQTLANSKRDLKRYQDLGEFATRQQVDTQSAMVGAQQAGIEADQAQIDSANVSLSYTTIRAPISGRTGIRQVDAGNIIHVSDATPIVVLTQLQPIAVTFTLPQQDLPLIQAREQAQASPLTVEARASDGAVLDVGTLELVDNQIDQSTGTIKLKARFPNPSHRLWPGQFVTARLIVDVRHGGLVVPDQAVQNGPDGPYVFIIGTDDVVTVAPVKIAQIEDGTALIDAGLQAGQRVVLDGQSRLRAGTRVTTKQAQASGG